MIQKCAVSGYGFFYPNAITVRCTVKSCFSFVLLYALKKKEEKKKKEKKKKKRAN